MRRSMLAMAFVSLLVPMAGADALPQIGPGFWNARAAAASDISWARSPAWIASIASAAVRPNPISRPSAALDLTSASPSRPHLPGPSMPRSTGLSAANWPEPMAASVPVRRSALASAAIFWSGALAMPMRCSPSACRARPVSISRPASPGSNSSRCCRPEVCLASVVIAIALRAEATSPLIATTFAFVTSSSSGFPGRHPEQRSRFPEKITRKQEDDVRIRSGLVGPSIAVLLKPRFAMKWLQDNAKFGCGRCGRNMVLPLRLCHRVELAGSDPSYAVACLASNLKKSEFS